MVDELFDESKRDSAIGRIGRMLERYFDGDASKLAVLLDPTRLNSPMYQFREEISGGFKAIEERLIAIEAAAAARGAERARSAAKGRTSRRRSTDSWATLRAAPVTCSIGPEPRQVRC